MNDNSVAIIIPVYNGEKYLKKTITSCLEQTYQNFQIIIINDFSSDNSSKIIEEFSNLNNVKVINNIKNLGINKSVNIGVKASDHKYLLFLGHDDTLPADYIENMLKHFKKGVSFIYCNPYVIDQYDNIISKLKKEIEIKKDELKYYMCRENQIMSTGVIMRRKLFVSVGLYDERYKNYGEWKLWIKLLKKGKAVYVDNIHSYYRKHHHNISNTFEGSKNIDTMKELHKYWNECRLDGLKGFKFSMVQKVQLWSYIKGYQLKYKFEEIMAVLNIKSK